MKKLIFHEAKSIRKRMPIEVEGLVKFSVTGLSGNMSELIEELFALFENESNLNLLVDKDYQLFWDMDCKDIYFEKLNETGKSFFIVRDIQYTQKSILLEMCIELGIVNSFLMLIVGQVSKHDFKFLKSKKWIFGEMIPKITTKNELDFYFFDYDGKCLIKATREKS